jgi:hypothetical protein
MISDDEIIELIKKAAEGRSLEYKEDLPLQTNGDKAEFVKDIIALANSESIAHIIVGIEDLTRKPVGIKTSHTPEQLNEILKDKTDPPLRVEYVEKDIIHYKIGVIEIKGDDPPYIVAVSDRFGGPLSANPQKQFSIERGTVFIRNFNKNEGARRIDLDKMYSKVDLRLSHEVKERKITDNSTEVNIEFILRNVGHVSGAFVRVTVQFNNISQIVKRTGAWLDISNLRKNVPTIQMDENIVHLDQPLHCDGAVVQVSKDVKQIEAYVTLHAMNMVPKKGKYVIPLES